MKQTIAAAIVAFLAIAVPGAVLALLYAPTTSTAGIVAYIGTMFAVTGATVAAVVVGFTRKE